MLAINFHMLYPLFSFSALVDPLVLSLLSHFSLTSLSLHGSINTKYLIH